MAESLKQLYICKTCEKLNWLDTTESSHWNQKHRDHKTISLPKEVQNDELSFKAWFLALTTWIKDEGVDIQGEKGKGGKR